MVKDNTYEEFIKELEALSKKYKIRIAGCGCCGSPWIEEIPDDEFNEDYGYTSSGISDVGWVIKNAKH